MGRRQGIPSGKAGDTSESGRPCGRIHSIHTQEPLGGLRAHFCFAVMSREEETPRPLSCPTYFASAQGQLLASMGGLQDCRPSTCLSRDLVDQDTATISIINFTHTY